MEPDTIDLSSHTDIKTCHSEMTVKHEIGIDPCGKASVPEKKGQANIHTGTETFSALVTIVQTPSETRTNHARAAGAGILITDKRKRKQKSSGSCDTKCTDTHDI